MEARMKIVGISGLNKTTGIFHVALSWAHTMMVTYKYCDDWVASRFPDRLRQDRIPGIHAGTVTKDVVHVKVKAGEVRAKIKWRLNPKWMGLAEII
jgi:hypothetical protein